MDNFDLMCLWIGRIILGGSASLIALSIIGLFVMKIIEKAVGKDTMESRMLMLSRLTGVLEWHEQYIKKEQAPKEPTK
jgi:hypothetical protein